MQVIQVIINGILLGGIYALLGVGMTMMFGIVKLTNLAHGEFIIIGAYLSTILANAIGVDPYDHCNGPNHVPGRNGTAVRSDQPCHEDWFRACTAGYFRSVNHFGRCYAFDLLSRCAESKRSLQHRISENRTGIEHFRAGSDRFLHQSGNDHCSFHFLKEDLSWTFHPCNLG